MSPPVLDHRNPDVLSLPSAPGDPSEAAGRPQSAPIVCGVDDSAAGRAAAETAAGLAALLGAPLVLVHVARPVTPRPFRSRRALAAEEAVRLDAAREVVERVRERCALGGLARVEIAVGDPAPRLALLAERWRAWMLVVGARRPGPRLRRPALSWRLGAVARCPVVIVPAPSVPAEPAAGGAP